MQVLRGLLERYEALSRRRIDTVDRLLAEEPAAS
jgi:hypothetical protein